MSIPGFDPNTAGNHEEIEMQFAVKTVEHLEVRYLYHLLARLTSSSQAYQKLLYALPPSKLKLTKVDDELFEDFKATFPELATPEALAKLDESEMKSEAGKEKWRNFIMKVSWLGSFALATFGLTYGTFSTRKLSRITTLEPCFDRMPSGNMTRTTTCL